MQPFNIGSSIIGGGAPPVFWPDIDVYFKNDTELAFRLIGLMKSQGVQAIKGAVIQRNYCLNSDLTTEYFVSERGYVTEPYRCIIERHIVDIDTLRRIYSRVRDLGLDIILSVYDDEGIALAEEMDAAAIKIPSSNIVHAPLIRAVASTGRPMVIDTGRSAMNEIERAVGWARTAGAEQIVIQHSPPGPPSPPEDFHLSMMPELGRRFNTPFGLSDHYMGTDMLFLAVVLGASVLEKGVCDDDARPDIDIAHALPVSQVGRVLEQTRLAYAALGESVRELPADRPRPRDRMGLVAAQDLIVGDILTLDKIDFAFPTLGIPVEEWDHIEGHRLTRPVKTGTPILQQYLEPHA